MSYIRLVHQIAAIVCDMSIEIEKRVFLTADQAQSVITKLDERAVTWQSRERLLMDFSGSLDDRSLQVMVRVNDGAPELSVKRGGVGDAKRQEASIHTVSRLTDVLEAVALLGYKEANYGLRSMKECELDGVELSFRYIRDITDPESILGVNLEIEALPGSGEEQVDAMLEMLDLKPMSPDEAKDLFKRLHAEANTDYSHSEEAALELAELVAIWVPAK